MFEVTDETFESEVLEADRPVIVDFWAPWCGPCKAVTAVLEQLEAEQEGLVDFAMVDIDENPLNASRFGVLSIPTAILFQGGEARNTVVGAHRRRHYETVWAPWLTSAR